MTDRDLLENILAEIRAVKIQQQEDHLILKALEYKSDINKAEHDKMINDEKFDDLKLAVDFLTHKQQEQERDIWEIRKTRRASL